MATLSFKAVGASGSSTQISWEKAQALSVSPWDAADENVVGAADTASICVGGCGQQAQPTRIAFTSKRDGNEEIYTMNQDGADVVRLTDNSARDSAPHWSPDTTRIAFVSERDGHTEIYVMNADGSGETRLTYDVGRVYWPTWSPDGSQIAFSYATENSKTYFYTMNPDGSNVRLLVDIPAQVYSRPTWSPDGTKLAFQANLRDFTSGICVINLDGSGFRRLTDFSSSSVTLDWSPDGQYIAYAVFGDVYVMNADGSNQKRILDDAVNGMSNSDLSWSPQSDQIVFASSRQRVSSLQVMNRDGSGLRSLPGGAMDDDLPSWAQLPIPSSVVTGRIGDGRNNPIAGVTVTATGPVTMSAVTDRNGNFLLRDLPAGTYAVSPARVGYTFSPTAREAVMPAYKTGLDFTAQPVATQPAVDLAVESVVPIQVLEGQRLVKEKATAVKVVIRKTGSEPANNVSVRLQVGNFALRHFFVAEAGNMNADYIIESNNTVYPLDFPVGNVTKTIYFFDHSLAPTGSTYQASVMVDDQHVIAETSELNNTKSSETTQVYDVKWGLVLPDLHLHYVRVDWDTTSINEYVRFQQYNDEFVRGVFPVSSQRFNSSRDNSFVSSSTLYRGPSGKMNVVELMIWAQKTSVQLKLAHPTADRFVAVAPVGWFARNTHVSAIGADPFTLFSLAVPFRQAGDLLVAEARIPGRVNGQSVVAHELGHSYGLYLNGCEEYDADCNGEKDRPGVSASPGLWVEKRLPVQPSSGRQIYSFMGGYDTFEHWVNADTYAKLLDDHKVSLAANLAAQADTSRAILAVGTLSDNGTATLYAWYTLAQAELSTLLGGPYVFEYLDDQNRPLYTQAFDLMHSFAGQTLSQSPFALTIPYVPGTKTIAIKKDGALLAQRTVSPHAPQVELVAPDAHAPVSNPVSIRWTAADADGDRLSYALFFSADGGSTWQPIASDIQTTSYTWDTAQLPPGTNYVLKVIATDGINTSEALSEIPLTLRNAVFLPLVSSHN